MGEQPRTIPQSSKLSLQARTSNLTRDWRTRTIIPVILIHLAAFAAIYAVIDHFASKNLLMTHKYGAAILLDELEFNFQDMMVDHTGPMLWMRLARQAQTHELLTVNVFNAEAQPIFSTRGSATPQEVYEARTALAMSGRPSVWMTDEKNGVVLTGARPLGNSPACRSCHGLNASRLGAIQIAVDLTKPLAEANARARRHLAYIVLAWLVLFLVMIAIRRKVIGGPIAAIESSLESLGENPHGSQSQDLEALAERLHASVWGLIERQREREENIARQLVRAEQLASLGEMAAGMTHEIKNPLSGVIAALEMLKIEDAVSPEHEEIYGQVLQELRRVTGTLDSLLRLARPQPPQRVPVDLERIVREIASLFSARCKRQGVSLVVDIPVSVAPVRLDPGLITQLLINLLTNGLQATDRGGIIKIFLAAFPRRDGVVLGVADTGRGIAPADLEKVFDPFFTTKEEGTGLGLAICRQIAEQHGGTINVESEIGKGTRVIVLLPSEVPGEGKEEEEVRDGAVAIG